MSKTKSSNTPHYELLYIVSNKYSEEELRPIITKVNKIIEENGGKITYSEDWGKKKLCYPINQFSHGYYNLIEFDCEGENMKKINKTMRIDSDILRFQIINKKVKTEEEKRIEKQIREKIVKKTQEKEKQEKQEAMEKAKAKDKRKVDLKDLDEKLDKILETDDLL